MVLVRFRPRCNNRSNLNLPILVSSRKWCKPSITRLIQGPSNSSQHYLYKLLSLAGKSHFVREALPCFNCTCSGILSLLPLASYKVPIAFTKWRRTLSLPWQSLGFDLGNLSSVDVLFPALLLEQGVLSEPHKENSSPSWIGKKVPWGEERPSLHVFHLPMVFHSVDRMIPVKHFRWLGSF